MRKMCLAIALSGLVALKAGAGDTLSLIVFNDGTDALQVTVEDLNAQPAAKPLVQEKIAGFASVTISASPGSDGLAHIRWQANSADPSVRKCSKVEALSLADRGTVRVFATSDCH